VVYVLRKERVNLRDCVIIFIPYSTIDWQNGELKIILHRTDKIKSTTKIP
jgi:hypothetical protein